MKAEDALREMRETGHPTNWGAGGTFWQKAEHTRLEWADAIEAELKAKDAEIARLEREVGDLSGHFESCQDCHDCYVETHGLEP